MIDELLNLLRRWENRLVRLGVHDNQRLLGLHLVLYPDGSGRVIGTSARVMPDSTDTDKMLDAIFSSEYDLFGFTTLAELHGELVAQTATT